MTVPTETRPPGSRMLGDGEAAVGLDLGDRVADASETGHLLEECIVAAAALGTAFDDVASRKRARERIVVVAAPVELPSGGADDQGGVGDAGANDDVGTLVQGFLDAPAAEVDVGGQHVLLRIGLSATPVSRLVNDSRPGSATRPIL